jgi:probable dihydroxyacetone kinase regulator
MPVFTKRALVEAFGKVLMKKSFKKITISDITDECGISRMTFYYHFKDIHALVEWTLEISLKDAIKGNFTYDTWKQGFLNVFYFALERKDAILKIYPEFEKRYLEDYLHKIAVRLTLGVINEKAVGLHIKDDDKCFMADICAYALVGVIISWVKNNMEEDPIDVVEKFSCIFKDMLINSLIRLSAPESAK